MLRPRETPDSTEQNLPAMHTYQITYVDHNGVTQVELIEANEVFTEEALKEFWLFGTLLLALDESVIQQIRNVSALDMGSPL